MFKLIRMKYTEFCRILLISGVPADDYDCIIYAVPTNCCHFLCLFLACQMMKEEVTFTLESSFHTKTIINLKIRKIENVYLVPIA